MKTAAQLVLRKLTPLLFKGTCQVNNCVQVTRFPEWPPKAQIILSEVMPFRKLSSRAGTVHTRSRGFPGRGQDLPFEGPIRAGSRRQEDNARVPASRVPGLWKAVSEHRPDHVLSLAGIKPQNALCTKAKTSGQKLEKEGEPVWFYR